MSREKCKRERLSGIRNKERIFAEDSRSQETMREVLDQVRTHPLAEIAECRRRFRSGRGWAARLDRWIDWALSHPVQTGCSHRRIMVAVSGRIDGWWNDEVPPKNGFKRGTPGSFVNQLAGPNAVLTHRYGELSLDRACALIEGAPDVGHPPLVRC